MRQPGNGCHFHRGKQCDTMLTPKQVTDFMTQLMTNPVWFDDGAFKLYLYCLAKALEEGATIDILLAALEADKQTPDWLTNNGQYIPGIVKWLQREAWRKTIPSEGTGEDEMWVSE